jgi:hypothetical protein
VRVHLVDHLLGGGDYNWSDNHWLLSIRNEYVFVFVAVMDLGAFVVLFYLFSCWGQCVLVGAEDGSCRYGRLERVVAVGATEIDGQLGRVWGRAAIVRGSHDESVELLGLRVHVDDFAVRALIFLLDHVVKTAGGVRAIICARISAPEEFNVMGIS